MLRKKLLLHFQQLPVNHLQRVLLNMSYLHLLVLHVRLSFELQAVRPVPGPRQLPSVFLHPYHVEVIADVYVNI